MASSSNVNDNPGSSRAAVSVAESCMKNCEQWYTDIKIFIEKYPKTLIIKEMHEMEQKYNSSSVNKAALEPLISKMFIRANGKDNLYKWYVFRYEHTKQYKADWNKSITDKEKEEREANKMPGIDEAKKLKEALDKGRASYREEKKRIQEVRDKLAREYKKSLDRLKAMDQKCEDRNKISIEFYKRMDDELSRLEDQAGEDWQKLSNEVRSKDYLDDFEEYVRNKKDEGILKWIIENKDDKYVKYCAKVHISGIRPKDTSEFESELRTMIVENNLEFLNSGSLEEIIDSTPGL